MSDGLRVRLPQARKGELTVMLHIAKLVVRQGQPRQARTMLEEIYNWFTESFDTADLKEAKALLDDLSR
jgi:hypothetical protein